MSKQIINIGQSANDRAGDPLRTAFKKVNDNFTELYANLTSYLPNPAGYAGKFLTTDGTNLLWESTVKFVQQDTPPTGSADKLWYDGVSGRVYTWYDDRWVDASPPLTDFKQDPPTSPQGAIGDTEGQWSGDFDYYYYCSGNYIGNNAPIWRRIAFDSSNNWDIYAGGGGGGLPANSIGYLYNNGSGTINWITNTDGYILPEATTSSLGGVIPDGTTILVNSGVISATPQVNSDWNASSGVGAILNKPTIPAAQIQSDWNITDNTLKSFIKNKPSIPSIGRFVFTNDQISVTDNGNISIHTNTHNWSFNSNGSLTFPDTSIQYTAYTGTAFPSQTGNSGKFLTTNGTGTLSWATVSGGGIPLAGATYDLNSGAGLIVNTTDGQIDFLRNGVTGVQIRGTGVNIYANNQAMSWDGSILKLPFTADIKRNDGTGNYVSVLGGGNSNITTGATAPSSPSVGNLWYDAVGGRMYVYYDGTWVDTNPVDGAGGIQFESDNSLALAGDLNFTYGGAIFEGGHGISGRSWRTGLNIVGSQTTPTDPVRIYPAGGDGKGFGMGTVNVKNDRVEIYGDNQGDGNGIKWTFAHDGSLTFPNGSKLDNGVAFKFATDNSVTQYIDLRDTSGRGFYTDGSGYTLRTSGSKSWVFDTAGVLSLPECVAVGAAVIQPAGNGFNLKLISNGNTWNFDTDGNLTVPGDIKSLAGVGPVVIEANDGTLRTWTFGGDGTLTLPTGGTVSYTPATAGDWAGDPPSTMQEAIDRLAAVVKVLNGGIGA